MGDLFLLALGMAGIFGFILLVQALLWVWDLWDKHKERMEARAKLYREPRRKSVDDYWKGAA